MIGAIIGAGVDMYNSQMNRLAGFLGQRQQYKYNLKLQQQQQEWQKKMWDLENLYNLPSNEVQRLLDAGINPALSFSNGGASAAPIPVSGSSGGVSSPNFPSSPSLGGQLASNLISEQRLSNETKVANSQADLNEAKAEEARAVAGRETSLADFQELQNNVYRSTMEVLKKFPLLNYNIRYLEYGLAQNSLIRDDLYTASFPQENSMRLERMRLDNRNVELQYNRLFAEINLLVARRQLTLEQAKEVSIRAQIALTRRYIARWNENFMRTFNARVYGDEYNVEGSRVFENVASLAKKEIANNLSAANLTELSLSNDYGFEYNYGADDRFYNFENNRRSANLTRSHIYTESIGSIVNAGVSAVTAGSSSAYRGALIKSLRKTNGQFRYNDSLPLGVYDYSY